MSGGYCGKLLRVDLTTGNITEEGLPDESVLRKWIGGTGLGLYLLVREMSQGVSGTDPEAPIIIITGPLTGTKAPSSSDWKIITVNPNLAYHPAVSQSHGYWGARLKHAGYDGIIITGSSPQPVYLWIDNGEYELRDASKYWGMDTFETQQSIAVDHQDMERISVACIGPAGENLVLGASVRNDQAYGCNKGNGGMVWGSKKLKAIAVRGTGIVPIHDYKRFIEISQKWRDQCQAKSPFMQEGRLGKPGVVLMPNLAKKGMIPAKNFKDGDWQVEWGKRYEEDMAKWKVLPCGSWECDMRCHHETLITTGPFAGTKTYGFGPENIEGSATIICIEDPGTCVAMANFYDAMGCDPSEAGRLIAMAFELYNDGLLTEEATGGLKLEWGNDEAARELFMQMLERKDLGAILAKGFKEAVKELGRGSEEKIMHIKNVGFNDHEQRGWGLGMLFQSMVAGAGPTWQGFGVENYPEPDLGYFEAQDPAVPDGKAEACYKTQMKKMWEDSTGVCLFATWGLENITKLAPECISAATGFDIDWEEAKLVGERVITFQRLYAVARGFKKEYDTLAAERILGPVNGGPAHGRQIKPYLNEMISEYYSLCGWDVDTGVPKAETLERLGLEKEPLFGKD